MPFLKKNIRNIFWVVINIFIILIFSYKFLYVIRKYDLKKLSIYKANEWDDGFIYFTAYKNNIKVFIKYDFLVRCLVNEMINIEYLSKIKNKPFQIPKLIFFDSNVICFEFIENSKKLISQDKKILIDKYLKKRNIYHNDLLDRNILYYKNFYIIDWYYSEIYSLKKLYKKTSLYNYYQNKLKKNNDQID
jgi:hypothetical protein